MEIADPARRTPDLVVPNPEWLPYSYDRLGDNLIFVRVPHGAHRLVPFLSAEALRTFDMASVPTSVVQEMIENVAQAPLHFIFHTAACGSTLLVNALASTNWAVGLKEPAIFQNLVHRWGGGEDLIASGRLTLVLRLLARPFPGTRAVLVKPSCFANPLLSFALAACPASKAILLSSDIRSYLLAIAKRGTHGEDWARQVHAACLKYLALDEVQSLVPTTALEAAGLAWLMRRRHFKKTAHLFPDRALLLDGSTLSMDSPQLRSALRFFEIKGRVDPEIFQAHSKSKRAYGDAARRLEQEALEAQFGQVVDKVIERLGRL